MGNGWRAILKAFGREAGSAFGLPGADGWALAHWQPPLAGGSAPLAARGGLSARDRDWGGGVGGERD